MAAQTISDTYVRMYMGRPAIHVRTAKRADARALCALLNEIIGIGGTTAFETPPTIAAFEEFLPAQTSSPAIWPKTATQGYWVSKLWSVLPSS